MLFSGLTGDFDDQGISFGALQWNFGQRSLQPLLKEMNEEHREILRDIFHARKLCIANGEGVVHGNLYHLESQYEIRLKAVT